MANFYMFLPFILALLSSCTYSINMIHSEGTASDMIDEQQSPKADITANVPISGI